MKTIILIDSIRPNPSSGRDRYAFPGKIQTHPDGSQSKEVIEVRTMHPEPSEFVIHKPTNVKCENCGKEFDYSDLQSDCMQDDDGEDFPINNICPKCGGPDCCEYEFETVEEFIRRKDG